MTDGDAWIAAWLDSVTPTSMTQRRLTSIDRHGGLSVLRREAELRGVHLVQLTDDQGNALVAASRRPFKVLC